MQSEARQLISARQAEIADLVVSGKSNREIAEVLYLSPRTVETHVAALFNKLGVRSRTELVAAILGPVAGKSRPVRSAARTNLPLQVKRLVGRRREVAEIARALESERLVTVTGAGGIGKTRTAVEVGLQTGVRWNDGAWLVELASLQDPALVAAAVALTLGFPDSPSGLPLDTLVLHLKKKSMLLILDNCEHVIVAAAVVVDTILKSCSELSILATSREPLNLAGELTCRLPSLGVPARTSMNSLRASDAATYDAIALFAERAGAIDRRFALSDENAPLVAEICRRLDGIPLAIELAAARVKVLPVKVLLEKLAQRFELVTGGDRSALPRHRTMRALVGWSYDLLSEPEQRLFEGLSVFAGGCTLGSLTAVLETADASRSEVDVLDMLSSLVDKSLVVAELDGRDPRYRLLESSREYARERLCARGEQTFTARRHALAFLRLAEQFEREWDSAPDRAWLVRTEAELENWRAALEWSLGSREDVVLGQRLAGALQPVWTHFASAEGRRWVRVARTQVDEATPADVVAQLDYAEAVIALASGELRAALAGGERALAGYRALGDALGTARAQHVVGLSLLYHGRTAEGEQLLLEALETLGALGRGRYVGFSLARIAYARSLSGDFAAARARYAEALEIFRALGAERGAAIVASNLAETEFLAGNAEAALCLAMPALASYRALHYGNVITHALSNLAAYQIALGRFDEARSHAREALELAREQQLDVIVVWAVQHLAAIAALRPQNGLEDAAQQQTRAARLAGFADARLITLGVVRDYDFTEKQEFERLNAFLRDALGADRFASLTSAGASMVQDEAVEQALLV